MYRILQQTIQARIQALIAERYDVALSNFVVELPPKIEFGEMALPVAFELAKRLKKAPRAIALELQPELAAIEGVASVDVAGAGYLNVKLDRAATVRRSRVRGRVYGPRSRRRGCPCSLGRAL